MILPDLLSELCAIPAPGGFEERASEHLIRALAPLVDEVRTDSLGNVIGVLRCGRENAPKLLLEAHMDEVGFVVTDYADGFLKFQTLGGIDRRVLPALDVKLLTEPPVYGVIDVLPPHIQKDGDADKPIDIDDLFIDVGLSLEPAKENIPLGTPGVFTTVPREFGDGYFYSKSLDNRSSVAAILHALTRLDGKKPNSDLLILFSAQEELGLRGAKPGTYALDPEKAIIVDVGFAAQPDAKGWETRKASEGVVISKGPNMSKAFTQSIIDVASARGIKYQIGIEPGGNSGTDAHVAQVSRAGVATALIGVPIRYMHTPAEALQLDDLTALSSLIYEVIR